MPDLESVYQRIVRYSERMFRDLDKLNRRDYATALKEARAVVTEAYRQYGSKGKLTYSEMVKYNRIKKLDAMLEDAIKNNTNTVAARTRSILSETAIESYDRSAMAIGGITGTVITKELTSAEIIAILQKPISGWTLNERIALRRSDLVIRVQGEVKRRLLQSASVEDTWKGVKTVIEKVYARDRTMLADDVHRVSQEALRAELEKEQRKGIMPTLTWVTAGDDKVRDAHRMLDGVTIDVGGYWEIPYGEWKGHRAMQPQGWGEPALDRNCRCAIIGGIREKD